MVFGKAKSNGNARLAKRSAPFISSRYFRPHTKHWSPWRCGGWPHWAIPPAANARRRRHGRGLVGRTENTHPPHGGAQADQSGHGYEIRGGTVRVRTAGTGVDGSSEHRQGV